MRASPLDEADPPSGDDDSGPQGYREGAHHLRPQWGAPGSVPFVYGSVNRQMKDRFTPARAINTSLMRNDGLGQYL
jgi:hypothetical protein